MYAREDARLHGHFNTVLAELTARDVSHLDRATGSRRGGLVAMLAAYARRGLFPRNPDHAKRTPYFIDGSGTRCAMAHLIEQSGDRELVERVAGTRNNAYVRELRHDLALRAWLQWAGLTAREAARIQPGYCFVTIGEACLCQMVRQPEGVFEGTVTGTVTNRLTVRVDAVHGDTGDIIVGRSTDISPQQSLVVGDSLIAQVTIEQGSSLITDVLRVEGNAVDLPCNLNEPTLATSDAIAAMLAASCPDHMTALDASWGRSQCEVSDPSDDGGCSAGGAGSPLIALVAAALWTRRRR